MYLVQIRRLVAPVLEVALGMARHGDAEVLPVLRLDEPHQVHGVRETALQLCWLIRIRSGWKQMMTEHRGKPSLINTRTK